MVRNNVSCRYIVGRRVRLEHERQSTTLISHVSEPHEPHTHTPPPASHTLPYHTPSSSSPEKPLFLNAP